MKKIFLLLLALTGISISCYAKIWRVNNNPGINANFTTLQEAHDGAVSGDTVYLESSSINYGALTSTKKLLIIGTGYFLDQNQGLQAFTLPSAVSHISLDAGSSGTIIEGLLFYANNGITINVNDIIIRRNNFLYDGGGVAFDYYIGLVSINSSASNIYITQNFGLSISNNTSSTGILISNNYIGFGALYGDETQNNCIDLNPGTVAIIKNNIFRRGTVKAYNSNISNNIMYQGFIAGSGNLIANNLANNNQFGTSDGNKANVDMSTVFYLAGSYDAAWQLKSGSPAIAAGYGSTALKPIDCGIYGGSLPYKLSGIPSVPSIYFFTNQPVGSNSDPIQVQIKVRSNN